MNDWSVQIFAELKKNRVTMNQLSSAANITRQRLHNIMYSESPTQKARTKVETALAELIGGKTNDT